MRITQPIHGLHQQVMLAQQLRTRHGTGGGNVPLVKHDFLYGVDYIREDSAIRTMMKRLIRLVWI